MMVLLSYNYANAADYMCESNNNHSKPPCKPGQFEVSMKDCIQRPSCRDALGGKHVGGQPNSLNNTKTKKSFGGAQ